MQLAVSQAQVSPLDYGLREATTGIGRYFALYNAHVAALQQGVEVDYSGIDTLELEIPLAFASIPLGQHTDFKGLVLYVTNHSKHGALFSLTQQAKPLALDKAMVDGLDFRSVPELSQGDYLLILDDKTPWTDRRGFGYTVYRKDLIVVHDGVGQNAPVAPWNTEATVLSASYCPVDTALKTFRNLTLHRVKGSSFKTYCLQVSGQSNVLVENVHVTTPKSRMIADRIFRIDNSTRVTLRDIDVEGTYSGYGSTRDYGYAFSLGNLYDTRYERIKAWGNWGVFGSNNLSRTELVDCDVDRFDIHCYGRDAVLRDCRLSKRQTLFTCMYGKVEFYNCHFKDYIPVRVRSSYNAYTPFDIEIHDCIWELTPRYHYLLRVNLLDTALNPRPELREKCWPNIYVDGLTIVVPLTVGRVYVIDPCDNRDDLKHEIGYISEVKLKGLKMVRPDGRAVKVPLKFSTYPFKSKNKINYEVD